MENTTPASSSQAASTSPTRASVPISVYRELASELQTAQTMLKSLKAENQQLARENQLLRQEVEKFVQSALHLQQVVFSGDRVGESEVGAIHELPLQTRPKKLYTEQEERPRRRASQPKRASDVSGWLLAASIFLILLTAFGAGFLILRPLLNGR